MSLSAFAFLFSELVQYNQTQVDNIAELERRWAKIYDLYFLFFLVWIIHIVTMCFVLGNVDSLSLRLEDAGYAVGARVLELLCNREKVPFRFTPKKKENLWYVLPERNNISFLLSFVHGREMLSSVTSLSLFILSGKPKRDTTTRNLVVCPQHRVEGLVWKGESWSSNWISC